jgi:hypothetical protein
LGHSSVYFPLTARFQRLSVSWSFSPARIASKSMSSRLPALEKNILKYRAFEMLLVLFHTESLKRFVVESLKVTGRLKAEKKIHKVACDILIQDGVITPSESETIEKLIDYRNDIAHRIYLLTCDLSRDGFKREAAKILGKRYDYKAVNTLKALRAKIEQGFRSRYWSSISPDQVLFEDTEDVFLEVLTALERKINRQYKLRQRKAEPSS